MLNTNTPDEELVRFLNDKARDLNLPTFDTSKQPTLRINYDYESPEVPLGSWVYGQKKDASGKIVNPGVRVGSPTVAILAVRFQYYYYHNKSKNYFRSPLLKQLNKAISEAQKSRIIKEVFDKTGETISPDKIIADHVVHVAVDIDGAWNQCVMVNFHGSNYWEFGKYLETFIPLRVPYCSYPTHIPNCTTKRNGASKYYVAEGIKRGGEMFARDLLLRFVGMAEEINRNLDSNTTPDVFNDAPDELDVMPEECRVQPIQDDGPPMADRMDIKGMLVDSGKLPQPPPVTSEPKTPTAKSQKVDGGAVKRPTRDKKVAALVVKAKRFGIATAGDLKRFVNSIAGLSKLTTLENLSNENYEKINKALDAYKKGT